MLYYTVLDKMPDVTDAQQHQLLYAFFRSSEEPIKRPFCYRDTGEHILMLSGEKPNTECVELDFKCGQTLFFECRASINARSHHGKKISPQEFTAKHVKDWFRRRLDGGAYVDYVTFKKLAPHKIRKNDGQVILLNQTMFYGSLIVMNPDQFKKIIATGIGKGGAFGFGMLLLPQVMK